MFPDRKQLCEMVKRWVEEARIAGVSLTWEAGFRELPPRGGYEYREWDGTYNLRLSCDEPAADTREEALRLLNIRRARAGLPAKTWEECWPDIPRPGEPCPPKTSSPAKSSSSSAKD